MAEAVETEPANERPTVAASPPAGNLGTFSALRVRDFRLLLIGTTLSNAAQWIQQVTIGWLVFDITGSGAILGTVNLVRSLATITLTPISGVAIDRFRRRTLTLMTNAWLLTITLAMGISLLLGHRELWPLFLFMFLGGAAQTVDIPLRQTLVFLVVPRELTPNAVALVQTGWGLMRSLGPALGGFLIVWFGPGGNFLIQAAAYGLIMVNILRMTFPPHQASTSRVSFLGNLKDGVRFIASQRTTRTFLMLSWALPLFIIPNFLSLTPIYAKEKFDGGAAELGLLMSAVGTGGIVGGLVAASLGRVDRRGRVQAAALLFTALSLMAFPFSPNLPIGCFFFACAGFFEMIFLTGNQTLLQLSIPDELRGRVTSITTLSMGLSPLGALYAGIGADLFGPGAITIAMSAAAATVAICTFLFVPTVRDYSLRRAITGGDGAKPEG